MGIQEDVFVSLFPEIQNHYEPYLREAAYIGIYDINFTLSVPKK